MKQTWWDNNLEKRFNEFESWVGPSSAKSKVWAREYVKQKGYKSLVDLGCGPATEFFAYKREYPELSYLGVDSSKFLYERNMKLGVPMLLSPIEETNLLNNHSEVAFSRHVLEHQPDFRPVLKEIIRLGSKIGIHIFFIKPGTSPEHIGYDPNENLYHNRYNKKDIEEFISPLVESFEWVDIGTDECALIIKKAL